MCVTVFIFSVLVFSFTYSLLDAFKVLCWLISQGSIPFPWFEPLHRPGQYSPDMGPGAGGLSSSSLCLCVQAWGLCEGSSVCTQHI